MQRTDRAGEEEKEGEEKEACFPEACVNYNPSPGGSSPSLFPFPNLTLIPAQTPREGSSPRKSSLAMVPPSYLHCSYVLVSIRERS